MTVDQSPAPDPRDPRAHCPVDFLLASEMIFGPNPGPATRQLGIGRGQVLRKAGQDFVADSASKGTPFLKYLGENGYCKGDPDALARAWTGVISGFVTPTFETFTTVLGQWIGSKELWRLQQALQGSKLLGRDTVSDRDLETSPLMLALKTTMPLAPVPDLLHREVVNDTAIDDLGSTGNPEMVAAGTRMVVGLGAVARADPSAWEILFGRNDAAPEKPIHGCPGYRMALGVMLGLTAGIVAQTNLQDDQPTLLRLKYGG
jgi:hypothetical protein